MKKEKSNQAREKYVKNFDHLGPPKLENALKKPVR